MDATSRFDHVKSLEKPFLFFFLFLFKSCPLHKFISYALCCGTSLSPLMISIFKITYIQPCSQKMHNLILTFFGIIFHHKKLHVLLPLDNYVKEMQEMKILRADAVQ